MSIQDSEIKVNKADSNYLNKKQQSGGLFLGFIFVLMLSSILALALWVNQISSTNNSNITGYEERIFLLEEQLNIVDSVNTDSMTGIASQLQFLDKEIRKLWDRSNKRNKVKLQETETRLEELKIRIESLQALNNYRKQNNAVIVQLQNEIRLLNSSILNLEKSSSAKGDNFITDEATSE
jgi:TolA-binding protein